MAAWTFFSWCVYVIKKEHKEHFDVQDMSVLETKRVWGEQCVFFSKYFPLDSKGGQYPLMKLFFLDWNMVCRVCNLEFFFMHFL